MRGTLKKRETGRVGCGMKRGARVKAESLGLDLHINPLNRSLSARIDSQTSPLGELLFLRRCRTCDRMRIDCLLLLRALSVVLTSYQPSTRLSPPLGIATRA